MRRHTTRASGLAAAALLLLSLAIAVPAGAANGPKGPGEGAKSQAGLAAESVGDHDAREWVTADPGHLDAFGVEWT